MENIVKLSIDGMHCDGCVRRVTNALASVEGTRVESVQVGSATVALDPAQASPEQLARSINRIGFVARVQS